MIKMKMFGFMKKAPQKPTPASAPASAPAPVVKAKGSTAAGKKFDMKNLDSIMRVKSTGCKSCGG
jgi:hypothetical protein